MDVHVVTCVGRVSVGVEVHVCACVGGCQCSHTDGVQRWFPPVLVTALLNPSRHSCVSPDTSEVTPVCPLPETFAGQACSFLIATIKDIRASENRNGRDPDSLPRASGQSLGADPQSPLPPPWAHSRLHSPVSLVVRGIQAICSGKWNVSHPPARP